MAHTGFKVIEIDGVKHRQYTTGTIKYIKPQEGKFGAFPKSACVYMVTDKTTGRRYIGSTINMQNRVGLYATKDLRKDVFRGLKWSDIDIVVIEDCEGLTTAERLLKEYDYIISKNTVYPEGNNKQCPVTQIKFDLLDMDTYNPLTHKYIRKVSGYNRNRYMKNKERISEQRKERYLKKKEGCNG